MSSEIRREDWDNLIRRQNSFYRSLGIDTMPLWSSTKKPRCEGWQRRSPEDMWQEVTSSANIGIRCGGEKGLVVIDADNKTKAGSSLIVENHLVGLGLDLNKVPTSRTANDGCHFYAVCQDQHEGNFIKFSGDLSGELRFGAGCYVVAPPSEVGGRPYELIRGDIRQLPILRWKDLRCLIGHSDTSVPVSDEYYWVERNGIVIPRLADEILQGHLPDKYDGNRSDAEQAAILSMINAGFSRAEIVNMFLERAERGKFREKYAKNPEQGMQYLKRSIDAGFRFAAHQSDDRKIAQRNLDWINTVPWCGRSGSSERAVYMAHCTIAYKAGKLEYHASARDLSEMANVSKDTAARVNKKLIKKGLVELVYRGDDTLASIYRLPAQDSADNDTLFPPPFCVGVYHYPQHDAFARLGLGKSAAEVYYALIIDGAMRISEIARKTGRHPETVRLALRRMSNITHPFTGEVLSIVRYDDPFWIAIPVSEDNLNNIAEVLGTQGISEERKKRHQYERDIHKMRKERRYR